VVETTHETVDPRIRRTRQLLQQSLQRLLETKDFDDISVQDIADAATVNRVTFYDHYADKFALLECVVGSRFQDLLSERGVRFDGTCSSALHAMVLGVCDYLGRTRGLDADRQRMDPHLESAIIAVLRRMIGDGLRRHSPETAAPVEMISTTVSWAIYGAAQQWVRQPDRCSSDRIAGMIVTLVAPILNSLHPATHAV
jgi:AcrR family transcriptional regulator